MEFLTQQRFKALSNPGVTSLQLLSPHNSSSTRVTLTRVPVEPGAIQEEHRHPASEQIWIAVSGHGELILGSGQRRSIHQGKVVRFEDGDTHGFHNTGDQPFVYLSMTSPPIDFTHAYRRAHTPALEQEP